MDPFLQPTLIGGAFAALAVAGGAPFFSDGLRAFRLRRQFERLSERPLGEEPVGFVHTRGRVLLDSPLFSPLTGRPCAGFRLEVEGRGMGRATAIEERRPFRLVSGETSARVMGGAAQWVVSETGRRVIEPGEALTENLSALLSRSPDVLLLRTRGVPIIVTERALFAGVESHVIAHARHARPYELPAELELMRTGTDNVIPMMTGNPQPPMELVPEPAEEALEPRADLPPRSTGPFGVERRVPGRPFPGEVDLWMDGGGMLDFMLVSDAPPAAAQLAISRWRTLGLLLGPALSISGLLYLAHAADLLHRQGRF